MIYQFCCTNCESAVVERQLSMKAEIPAEVTVEEGCSACGGEKFRRVWSVPFVPFKVRTGRDFRMSEAKPLRDKSWKKRVMGEKYDGR